MAVERARVLLRSDIDPQKWRANWQQGKVPGELPYGFQRLGESTVITMGALPNRRKPVAMGRSVFARFSDDLTITWDEETLLSAALSSRLRNLATGVIWATDEVRAGRADRRLKLTRALLQRVAHIWVLSPAQVQPLKEWLGPNSKANVHFVPFGIDTDFFAPLRVERRPLVVSVGNDRDRDAALALDIMQRLRTSAPAIECLIQSRTLREVPAGISLVRELSPADLRLLYASAAVNLVVTRPNLHVSGMTSALESMAMRTPTFATYSAGFEAYMGEGKGGEFFDRDDRGSGVRTLIDLITGRGLEKFGVEQARTRVLSEHTEKAFHSRLAAALEITKRDPSESSGR